MSCDKWAYDPKMCDDQICPGDCDNCNMWEKAVAVAVAMSADMSRVQVKSTSYQLDDDDEEKQAVLALRKGEE